ncbi:MAG TPA: P-loop NTPase fold protein, partial [Clostridia bacterium]|nr:P-loop NTPase fold protein [Clostridia bacterium]
MEYYFDTDDKLDRRKYAEFLKSMLENCDKYRREDSEGAYVIAIDSPWGTGKTRFAKMLRNFLEGREPQVVEGKADKTIIPEPQEDRKFNVIYYNSWETDYWTDAIEPLISNIINSDVFKEFREDARNKELWNQFKEFAKGVLEASVDLAAAYSIWGTILNIVIHGVKKAKEKVNKPFEEFEKKQKLYSDFANSLSQIIRKTDRKLLIIVDELDRCRPTFAIQTLELVKHLFSVRGLIFIFALDIKQLSCSVKTVYGQELDASGYLSRFFD